MGYLERIAAEPPFRLLTRWLVQKFSRDVGTRARWCVDSYPQYQFGILEAARLAERHGQRGISIIEFGVATGRGLIAMERHACAVEQSTGIEIAVIGFDSGVGLPSFTGDYRDHPDQWRPGDYRINVGEIQRRIDRNRTRIIIGDVRNTVPELLERGDFSPIGFISFDLDLYSSTRAAMKIIEGKKRKMLPQTPLYFDDIDFIVNHRWAGELLAIREFNQENDEVKIDVWYNVRHNIPFPEQHLWDKMMVAHDLRAISKFTG